MAVSEEIRVFRKGRHVLRWIPAHAFDARLPKNRVLVSFDGAPVLEVRLKGTKAAAARFFEAPFFRLVIWDWSLGEGVPSKLWEDDFEKMARAGLSEEAFRRVLPDTTRSFVALPEPLGRDAYAEELLAALSLLTARRVFLLSAFKECLLEGAVPEIANGADLNDVLALDNWLQGWLASAHPELRKARADNSAGSDLPLWIAPIPHEENNDWQYRAMLSEFVGGVPVPLFPCWLLYEGPGVRLAGDFDDLKFFQAGATGPESDAPWFINNYKAEYGHQFWFKRSSSDFVEMLRRWAEILQTDKSRANRICAALYFYLCGEQKRLDAKKTVLAMANRFPWLSELKPEHRGKMTWLTALRVAFLAEESPAPKH